MEEKKIGILSIISLVAGIVALLTAVFTAIGLPLLITLVFMIAAVVLGIIALIKKEKVAMPVIGICVGTLAIIIAFVCTITRYVVGGVGEYVYDSLDDITSGYDSYNNLKNYYDYNSLYNYTNGYNYNSLYNTTNTFNSLNTTNSSNTTNKITTNTTTTGDTQKVGDVDYGFVTVPKNWNRFYDPDAPGTFQYSYANVYIVTLMGIGNTSSSLDYMAESMKQKLATENTTNTEVTDTTVGGYTAKKVRTFYPSENIWLDIYFVTANNKMYYISMEGPDKDSEYFKIPNTFTLFE